MYNIECLIQLISIELNKIVENKYQLNKCSGLRKLLKININSTK